MSGLVGRRSGTYGEKNVTWVRKAAVLSYQDEEKNSLVDDRPWGVVPGNLSLGGGGMISRKSSAGKEKYDGGKIAAAEEGCAYTLGVVDRRRILSASRVTERAKPKKGWSLTKVRWVGMMFLGRNRA